MTFVVAALAVETGIAPNDLLATDPVMFRAMLAYIKDRNRKIGEARRGRG